MNSRSPATAGPRCSVASMRPKETTRVNRHQPAPRLHAYAAATAIKPDRIAVPSLKYTATGR